LFLLGITNFKGFNQRQQEELATLTTNSIHVHDIVNGGHEFLAFNGAATSCTSKPEDQIWILKKRIS
jgi:hypothetical protein